MKLRTVLAASTLFTTFALSTAATALDVNITADLPSVDVMHGDQKVTIMRNQDQKNTINPDFAKTSRKCPPKSILVIDSRTPDWVEKGTIPGAVNIPWDKLNIGKSDPITVQDILEKQLGAKQQDGFWDFSGAKTLVMFCNGPWCGQSPTNIKGLLKIGYPADKIKWYRGGMQDWEVLGLSTAKPAK
jgi:rhodanese-related sulfurtransferase